MGENKSIIQKYLVGEISLDTLSDSQIEVIRNHLRLSDHQFVDTFRDWMKGPGRGFTMRPIDPGKFKP